MWADLALHLRGSGVFAPGAFLGLVPNLLCWLRGMRLPTTAVCLNALIAHLEPLQGRYKEIITEQEYLTKVLQDGQEAADEVASRTLASAKRAMGFTLPGDTKLPKL